MNKETRQFIMGLFQFILGGISLATQILSMRNGEWIGDLWSWCLLIASSIFALQGYRLVNKNI